MVDNVESNYTEIFSRNLGFFDEDEQNLLRSNTVGVAGVGGVGGLLVERLIRTGVGHVKFTDPGTFDKSNLNRQFGSSFLTLDKNKANVVYQQVKDINTEAQVEYFEDGLSNESDINRFVEGCDIIVDEMDTTAYKQSILLQRASRKRGLHYLFSSALGFGALVATFAPGGQTLEEYNGLVPGVNLNQLKNLTISLEKMAPVMPSYASKIPSKLIGKIMEGEVPIPTTSIGVGLASIMGTNEAINILLKKREIIIAPRYIYIDLLDLQSVIGTM
ncbi:MAG: ThiF family adenylyltransferase [Dehalococcoidales bacterium]|nr:ThiF family adenylyltransferase [Dehalococcoidales bacterium]